MQELSTATIYHIPVAYSYGRAGKRLDIGEKVPVVGAVNAPEYSYREIAGELASGKRKDVVDRKKTGGVKARVNKLSLAGNRVFFRLDIRNQSNLTYEVDFIRFYIRDLKTVARMATHEQEIVPLYQTLKNHTAILKSNETAQIFAFRRFSLSEDQVLNIEVYERNGNRNIYLQIGQKDLDGLKTINPVQQQPVNTIAANTF
ncbi:DUF4138 domain-containing protein [Mucilaginibacter sp. S1162]|uniref:DUF4138 domain-containing protein n=1 Tax=Mucilaginibacter humi TaxID=2732510 RepID=A0ABX1W167_9SPHI|nr:DUF4138 domain-containing protein [Mucilaginibacter humi]NNU33683.1 DUF4138 domain-containing protein [Mucilaginibacter humi]